MIGMLKRWLRDVARPQATSLRPQIALHEQDSISRIEVSVVGFLPYWQLVIFHDNKELVLTDWDYDFYAHVLFLADQLKIDPSPLLSRYHDLEETKAPIVLFKRTI